MERKGITSLFFVLLLLASCSNSNTVAHLDSPESKEVPADLEKRTQLASNVAVQGPFSEGSPFGLILKIPKDAQATFCTVSHFQTGKVLTSSHCLSKSKAFKATDYTLIFFDHQGIRKISSLEKFTFIGNPNSDDMAMAEISSETAFQWPSLEGQFQPLKSIKGQRPVQAQRVTVWGFDLGTPIQFRPKQCLASQTFPHLMGHKNNPVTIPVTSQASENLHVFIDECSETFKSGNSGALITSTDRNQDLYGVFHWTILIPKEFTNRFDSLTYIGNSNEPRQFQPIIEGTLLFGVGFVIHP